VSASSSSFSPRIGRSVVPSSSFFPVTLRYPGPARSGRARTTHAWRSYPLCVRRRHEEEDERGVPSSPKIIRRVPIDRSRGASRAGATRARGGGGGGTCRHRLSPPPPPPPQPVLGDNRNISQPWSRAEDHASHAPLARGPARPAHERAPAFRQAPRPCPPAGSIGTARHGSASHLLRPSATAAVPRPDPSPSSCSCS
jgi:hypothetical protein